MRVSWLKSAVALGTLIMITGVSVPVGVSASVATQSQKVQKVKVSQKQVDRLNQQVNDLSASSLKKRVNKLSSAQLHKLATKSTKQVKQAFTDPKIASAIKSVTLDDVKDAATASNVAQLKKVWTTKAADQLQNKMTHTNGLTAAEAAAVQKSNLAQDIQQVTPAQIKSTLGQLSDTQWETLIQQALTTADQTINKTKTPSASQIRQQAQQLSTSQVAAAKQKLQTATSKIGSGYYTDTVGNPDQVAVRSNLATSLLGLMLPAISLVVKLTIGPALGIPAAQLMYSFVRVGELAIMTIGLGVVATIPVLAPIGVSLVVPVLGPMMAPIIAPFTLFLAGIAGSIIFVAGNLMGFFWGGYLGLITGLFAGVPAALLAPILPPVLTPPMVTLSRRLDQEITYADSLKSGHQYTQAINVKAGHAYRVSFKADQASNPETNDPITNFGSLTYGLVANKTDAIGNSDVSDTVTNVQNGSTKITSRAKTNYVITFNAKQNGTIYLVADTAEATIHTGIKQSQYSTTPLWYVNTAVDTTLN